MKSIQLIFQSYFGTRTLVWSKLRFFLNAKQRGTYQEKENKSQKQSSRLIDRSSRHLKHGDQGDRELEMGLSDRATHIRCSKPRQLSVDFVQQASVQREAACGDP